MKKTLLILISVAIFSSAYSQEFNKITKVTASVRANNDFFGWSVSISGNYAIVGARTEDEDASEGNTVLSAGSAYLFERDSVSGWAQVQKVVASDRAPIDYFGYSVAISGNYAIVGANREDEDTSGGNFMSFAGSAYIFERDSSGNWAEVQKIVASDRAPADEFGRTLAINGNYAIIGVYQEDEDPLGGNTMTNAGSAYVFERDSSGNWIEVQKIVSSDRAANDRFGFSVSISGNYALVGASFEFEDASGGNTLAYAGSAYVFKRDSAGNWSESQKIVASDRDIEDGFGYSVFIDGKNAIISAFAEDDDASGGDSIYDAGSAYLFEQDSNGNWMEVQKIVASDRAKGDVFGRSVSISGNYALVGADREDEDASGNNTLPFAGSAYVFERDSIGSWNQLRKIVASKRDSLDIFGLSVSISGNVAFVAAFQEDQDVFEGDPKNSAGSAYFFEYCPPSSSTLVESACDSYISPSGNFTWNSSGIYIDILPNATGCDSTITINLTINTVDTSITQSNATLTANASGATYQWLDCNNNLSPISGETNQNFTATANGMYSVIISKNGCTDTSSCYEITGIGIIENDFGFDLSLYPNPSNGHVTITLGTNYDQYTIEVFDTEGKLISTHSVKQSDRFELNIEGAPGAYFVSIKASDRRALLKLIKE